MNFVRVLFAAFIFFLFIGLISCESSKKNETKKTSETNIGTKSKKEIQKNRSVQKPTKKTVKDWDSINDKNAIDFLIRYGELNKETKVLLKTRLGNITIKLYTNTELHRANFIFLVKSGYFDTTCFYRVVPNFIIQGGNSENMNTLRYRNKYKHYRIPAELHNNNKHKYGAVAAARDWENNPAKRSTPFEFYIVQNKKGAHHIDGEHTVFGEVISGFATIDKIVNLKSGGDEWPLVDVFIKAEVIE